MSLWVALFLAGGFLFEVLLWLLWGLDRTGSQALARRRALSKEAAAKAWEERGKQLAALARRNELPPNF